MACEYILDNKKYTKSQIANLIRKGEISFINMNQEKARQYLREKLNMNDDEISFVSGLIDNKALGRFMSDGNILLSNYADMDVLYHEAFHRVWQVYLNEQDRNDLIEEFKKNKDYKSTLLQSLNPAYHSLDEARQIEEYFADMFAEYTMNNGDVKLPKVQKSLFARLLDFIKNLLGVKTKMSLSELMSKINEGKYSNSRILHQGYVMDAMIEVGQSEISSLALDEVSDSILSSFIKEVVSSGLLSKFLRAKPAAFQEAVKSSMLDITSDMLTLENYVDKFGQENIDKFDEITEKYFDEILSKYDSEYLDANSIVNNYIELFDVISDSDLEQLPQDIVNHIYLALDLHDDIYQEESIVFDSLKEKMKNLGMTLVKVKQDYSNEDDNTDDEYDKSEMTEEGQGVGVSFDKFSAEFSPDSSTSTKLKLLLSSLTDTSLSEELRLSKPYVYHDISNYLFNNLYGVPSTFEDFQDRFDELKSQPSYYKSGIEQLHNIIFNDNNVDNRLLAAEFISIFSKDKTEFIQSLLDETDKGFKTIEQVKYSQRNTAETNLNSNAYIQIDELGGLVNWIDKLSTTTDTTEKLVLLGGENILNNVDIEDGKIVQADIIKAVDNLVNSIVGKKDALLKSIDNKKLNIKEAEANLYKTLKDGLQVGGYVSTIVDYQMKSDETIELSVFNGEGKKVYAVTLNSYQTQIVNGLNFEIAKLKKQFADITNNNEFKETVRTELAKKYPQVMQAYNRHSLLLDKMLEKGTSYNLNIMINSGVKNNKTNNQKALTDLKRPDLGYISINQMLDKNLNYIQGMKHSDRGQLYNYVLTNDKQRFRFISDTSKSGILAQGRNYIKNHLSDELLRNILLKELGVGNNIQYYRDNKSGSVLFGETMKDDNGEFKLFPEYNSIPDSMKQAIRDGDLTSYDKAYNEFYNKELTKFVDRYIDFMTFNDEKSSTQKLFKDWFLLDSFDEKSKPFGVNTEVWNSFKNSNNSNTDTLNAILLSYTLNGLIGNIEQTKVILGDFNFYKNAKDVPKRLAVASSTGQLPVHGDMMDEIILSKNDEFEIDGTSFNYYSTRFKKDRVDRISEIVYAEEEYAGIPEWKEATRPLLKAAFVASYKLAGIAVNEAEIDRKVEKQLEAYDSVNEPDGASWMNIFAFKEFFERLGRWTPNLEKSFQEELKVLANPNYTSYDLESGKTFTDIYGAFANLKLQYYGTFEPHINTHSLTDEPGYFRTVLQGVVKSCYSIMTPSQLRVLKVDDNGNITHEKRNLWYAMEQSMKQGLDVLHMGSARKIGSIVDTTMLDNPNYMKGMPRFYNTSGEININDDFQYDNVVQYLDWQYMKLQVESHFYQEDEIVNSTQSLKNTIADIIHNNKPIDATNIDNWDSLDETEKRRLSPIWNTVQEYIDNVTNTFISNLEDMAVKLDYSNKGTSNRDIEKIQSLIESALLARNTTSNIIDVVEQFAELEYKYIEFLPGRSRIEPVLFSIVTNGVLNQKRPGSAFPQDTSQGWEVGNRNLNTKGEIMANSHYKFLELENGELVTEVGIVLPTDWIDGLYQVYNEQMGNSKSLDKLVALFNKDIANKNYSKFDKEILYVKGLRIPNQSVASNDMFTVKEFFVPSNITRIVVPSQVVVKVGSDFDFDKVFSYRANTAYNPDTKKLEFVKRNKTIDIENIDFDGIRNNIEAVNNTIKNSVDLPKGRLSAKKLIGLKKILNDLVKSADGIKTKSKRVALISDYKQLLDVIDESINTINNIDKNNKTSKLYLSNISDEDKIRQNELLLLEHKLLSNPLNIGNLTRPTDEAIINTVSKNIDEASGKKGVVEFESKGYSLVSPAYNVWLTEVMVSTKAGVGVVAVHITGNTIANYYGFNINKDYIQVNKNSGDETVISTEILLPSKNSYTNLMNNEGYFTSDILSAILSLQVDGAKNPRSVLMNMGLRTLGLANYLIRNGVDATNVIKYLMQPAVLEYNRQQDFWESQAVESQNLHNDYVKMLKDKGYEDVKTSDIPLILTQEQFGTNDLIEATISENVLNSGLRGDLKYQMFILNDYLRMIQVARMGSLTTRVFSPDTSKPKNMNSVLNRISDAEELEYSQFLRGFTRNQLMTKSGLLRGQALTQQAYKDFYEDFYVTLTNEMSPIVDIATRISNSKRLNKDAKEKRVIEVQNEFINFLIQKYNPLFKQYSAQNILVGKESLGKEIKALQEQYTNSILFKSLLVREGYESMNIDGSKIPINTILLNTDTFNPNILEKLYREIENLKTTHEDLYNKLLVVDIYQHGLNNSRFSLSSVLPLTEISEFIQKAYTNFKQESYVEQSNIIEEFKLKLASNNPKWLTHNKDKRVNIFPYAFNKEKNTIVDMTDGKPYQVLGNRALKVYNVPVNTNSKAKTNIDEPVFDTLNIEDIPITINYNQVFGGSDKVDKTSIQMQPQNVEKILNGVKTTTIRESIPKGGNIAIGETKLVNFEGKDFYVTNRGYLTIQEAGGIENILKSEGLNSINDFMYNQSKNWANGNGRMYVFDISKTNPSVVNKIKEYVDNNPTYKQRLYKALSNPIELSKIKGEILSKLPCA